MLENFTFSSDAGCPDWRFGSVRTCQPAGIVAPPAAGWSGSACAGGLPAGGKKKKTAPAGRQSIGIGTFSRGLGLGGGGLMRLFKRFCSKHACLRELLTLERGLVLGVLAQVAVGARLFDLLRKYERDLMVEAFDFCLQFLL